MNRLQLDADAVLIDLVAFKWLMAGLGWWVDLGRFRRDAAYARVCAERGAGSELAALRQRSAALLAQMPRSTLRAA